MMILRILLDPDSMELISHYLQKFSCPPIGMHLCKTLCPLFHQCQYFLEEAMAGLQLDIMMDPGNMELISHCLQKFSCLPIGMHHCKTLCPLFHQCRYFLEEAVPGLQLGHCMIFLADKVIQHLIQFTAVTLLIENKPLIIVHKFRSCSIRGDSSRSRSRSS